MTGPSSTAANSTESSRWVVGGLLALAAASFLILSILFLGSPKRDPYINATIELQGSAEHGGQLFRMNCAGCHGIGAQGLLGPDLHNVSNRRSDAKLIKQVVGGTTPPMPSFEMEPQAMADLLAHLHSLS
ncbi:MAG: c-type cytochrome [Prochlorococcus sp.]|nr:cytochrome c [Prochlorococcus sp.]MDP6192830.1 cytochrome c [Prochlorococcaceae cyanobacterium ETNP18_MAG_1]CAI8165978.1 MAG: Uncharacterised protein [Prochlorococcus marinus str. MIT 9215]